jgi:hypothetical protein
MIIYAFFSSQTIGAKTPAHWHQRRLEQMSWALGRCELDRGPPLISAEYGTLHAKFSRARDHLLKIQLVEF